MSTSSSSGKSLDPADSNTNKKARWDNAMEADNPADQTIGKLTDLTITCNDRSWKLHKGVVFAQSKTFAAMIEGGFQESQTATINLSDDEPDKIDLMVQFLYRGKYPATLGGGLDYPLDGSGDCTLQEHVEMYILGDKYDIPTLSQWALHAYSYEAMRGSTKWSSIFKEQDAVRFEIYVKILKTIDTIYGGTPMREHEPLRYCAAYHMTDHHEDLSHLGRKFPELITLRDEMVDKWPDFAVRILKLIMKKPSVVCESCKETWLEGWSHDDPQYKHEFMLSMECTICHESRGTGLWGRQKPPPRGR